MIPFKCLVLLVFSSVSPKVVEVQAFCAQWVRYECSDLCNGWCSSRHEVAVCHIQRDHLRRWVGNVGGGIGYRQLRCVPFNHSAVKLYTMRRVQAEVLDLV